jgi:iron complex outermembrane receptor protein
VLNPVDSLDITADFYRIDIDDRVILTDNFSGAKITELLAPFAANSARFFSNAIDTSTKGVDLIANFVRSSPAAGVLRLQAAYNHTRTRVTRVSATPPQLAGFENILFAEQSQRLYTCGQPTDNIRLTEDWQKGRFGVVVREGRYGTFCSIEVADQTFGANVDHRCRVCLPVRQTDGCVRRRESVRRLSGSKHFRDFQPEHPDLPA